MRSSLLLLSMLLSGCMPGCGGDVEGPTPTPTRLAPASGDEGESAAASSDEFAEPPPVEPPPNEGGE